MDQEDGMNPSCSPHHRLAVASYLLVPSGEEVVSDGGNAAGELDDAGSAGGSRGG